MTNNFSPCFYSKNANEQNNLYTGKAKINLGQVDL